MTVYLETKDERAYERILGLLGCESLKCAGFTRFSCDNGEVRIDEELFCGKAMRRNVTHRQGKRDAWDEFFSGEPMI